MYSAIALVIQFSCLVLQFKGIGVPYTSMVAILGFIPVLYLSKRGL